MTRDHEYAVDAGFLGVLGGLIAYGLIGVFLGPILVVVYSLLLSWLAEPRTD